VDEWLSWWRWVRRFDTLREPGDDRLMTDFGRGFDDALVGADELGLVQSPAA